VANVRRSLARALGTRSRGEPVTVIVEVIPALAGVAEAADVMGWDKRRVITYIDRGRFPAPIQALASGRVWVRSEVEEYAAAWRARRRGRRA
jgi:predicted DNA-binding transcriptional regulator AlpA